MTAKSSAPDFCVGSWIVRPSLSRIERGELAVHLTPRAMSVLVELGAARGAVVARNALLDAVWLRMSVTPDALSQCIAELRRAFGDDSRHPAVIETIPRVGMRLILPVRALEAAPPVVVAAAQWRPWVAALSVAAVVIAVALLLVLPRELPPASSATNADVARPPNPEAYDLYLTARYFQERGDFRRTVLYAQQAVAADPKLALAHALLAAGLTYQDIPFKDPERRARADAESQLAVGLDPTSAEAQALRAAILWELGELAECERYAAHALELDPANAQAQQVRAWLLMHAGRVDESLATMVRARGAEPLSPLGHAMVGQWQYLAGRTDAAIESLERALELAPDHTGARRALGLSYFEKGREREAVEQYLRLPISDQLKEVLRATLALDGSRGTLEFRGKPTDAYCADNGLMAAEVFAYYSADEPMLGCLRDAVMETPYPDLTLGFWMRTGPVFAAYRSDERFTELLRASGLPQ